MSNIHEECGVFGIFSHEVTDVASSAYYALFALQHRGQESCGIVVNDDGLFHSYKDVGLVNDVFTKAVLEKLGPGTMAVGHCLYGADGTDGRRDAQPLVVNHVKGRMAISYNGNLVNAAELRRQLELDGAIFHTRSDAEVFSYIITKERLNAPSIEEAISKMMDRVDGAYSLVIMSPRKLIAVRDPHGIRPLCYGRTEDGRYVVASESCALTTLGATLVRDVHPGEILIFEESGMRSITNHCNTKPHASCIFEYIYFARPDSVVDGVSVHTARLRAGAYLAKEHPVDADVVIGVPDSGLDAAIGYAKESGIPYEMGFLKNKYIGRTFIVPGQKSREDLVRIKLNPIADVVKGKRVVMVDDSIVRGTTCARIIRLLREAGAKEVHMRISSPPFIDLCYYGTDIGSRENLIAANHSIEEVARMIGVDSLGYLSLEHVKEIAAGAGVNDFCIGCFNGCYPTAAPTENRKSKFESKISDNEQNGKE